MRGYAKPLLAGTLETDPVCIDRWVGLCDIGLTGELVFW